MRSSHRSQAHPDTRLGPDPCSHPCGNQLRPAMPAYPGMCLYTMIDDPATPNRVSATPPPTSSDTATPDQNTASACDGASAYTHDRVDVFDRVQTCACELVQLLHRMPVSSRKKQTAIRLLVKVIRLVTPSGHRAETMGPAAQPPKTTHGNGTISMGSSSPGTASKTRRNNSADDASDSHSDTTKSAKNRPDDFSLVDS